MRHFAANYIFDGENLIKNSFISVDENNKIIYVGKENEGLTERPLMIFYNGILTPGFVNAHCHLELSDFEKTDESGKGLVHFIKSVISTRIQNNNKKKIGDTDQIMFESGISLVADIVNSNKTIDIKKASKIAYHSFVEIAGIKNSAYEKKIAYAETLHKEFNQAGLAASVVPHSFYSINSNILNYTVSSSVNNLTSIHFLESDLEYDFFAGEKNSLYDFLSIIYNEFIPIATNHDELYQLLIRFAEASSIILVHNTKTDYNRLPNFSNFHFCICPASNLYLHNTLPSTDLVYNNIERIAIGTDSIASNHKLNILNELKLLSENYQNLTLANLLKIGTANGANALMKPEFGRFKIGLTPGVVLIENADLINLKLKESTFAKRII